MDNLTPSQRKKAMANVKSQDTNPEMKVRHLVHSLGYRYRLHRKNLPGNPDLTFPRFKKVIFVHGCFWHQHEGCPASKRPTSNTSYWNQKLDRNVKRDKSNQDKLNKLKWSPLILWECQTRNEEVLKRILLNFFSEDR
jgi:DNA mismatch endonuclease (patch repair protein)